jgi:hypothetical protein
VSFDKKAPPASGASRSVGICYSAAVRQDWDLFYPRERTFATGKIGQKRTSQTH